MIIFLLIAATFYTVAVILGKRINVIPIVMQLLVAFLIIPWIVYSFKSYGINISTVITNNNYMKFLYDINFALILSYILSDSIGHNIDKKSIKIATLSFIIPFAVGIITAYLYLTTWNILTGVSLALLFSITAVPVLYLLLKSFKYDPLEIKKLIQTAIIIDLVSWTIFALLKDIHNLNKIIYLLLIGMTPLVIKYIYKKIKRDDLKIYGQVFFVLVLILEYFKLNVLLFGVIYMLCSNILKKEVIMPIPETLSKNYQIWIAIPYILTFGMVQVDISQLIVQLKWNHLLLLILPILSKIVGNYLGLIWANNQQAKKERLIQSILLNTRGLTEIVFLNLLLTNKIIDNITYMVLMFMGLISTLLPLLLNYNKTNNEKGI